MPAANLRLALLFALFRVTVHWSVTRIPSFMFPWTEQSRTVLPRCTEMPPPMLASTLQLVRCAPLPVAIPTLEFAEAVESIIEALSPVMMPTCPFKLALDREIGRAHV